MQSYRSGRIQRAGKSIHVSIPPSDVEGFIEALHPEGVMLHTRVSCPEEADGLVMRVSRWTRG
jgi:hypothetical protein